MAQNATKSNTSLGAGQRIALDALLVGRSVTDAAKAARVNRSTVHRWLREPEFIAAQNTARGDMRSANEARLAALGDDAIDALEAAIDSGDVRAAIAVAKGLGLLSGDAPHIGSEDPQVLHREQDDAARWEQLLAGT